MRTVILLMVLAALAAACVPQKKIKYLQKAQAGDTASFNPRKRDAGYRIQANDNLYVRVYTLDERASMFFNKLSGATTSYSDYANDASIYLNSYTVNADGAIDFPVVGRVEVAGKTVDEVKTQLTGLIGEYLKETTVVVKLVNFRVTLVGEVMRPGQFTVYKDEFNIFEAISMGGDLGEFADRQRVALIRQVPGGSQVHYLDLTSESLLRSPYYFVEPNDIIYVPPLGYKRWGLGSTFPWALVLAGISTTLLLINYFK